MLFQDIKKDTQIPEYNLIYYWGILWDSEKDNCEQGHWWELPLSAEIGVGC